MNDILNMEGLETLANGTTETDDAIAIAVARRGRSRDWCPHCGAPSASAAMPKLYGSDIATLTRLIEGGHLLTPPTEFAE